MYYTQPPQQQQYFPMPNADFSNMHGMDFLGANNTFDFESDTSGLDLGFGMGNDFQHDWNDGSQLNLFDDFFFGNNNGGV